MLIPAFPRSSNIFAATPFKILDKQTFARQKPCNASAGKGHGRLRPADHDQASRGAALHRFIEVLDLIAEVMQTAAALQKFFDRGAGTRRFDQFDARITGVAGIDERYAHALKRIVPSF